MPNNLLIIESPNKIETINKYLKDKSFAIYATIGHVRDLAKHGLGFNPKTLEPNWIVSSSKAKIKGAKTKKQIIAEIKDLARDATTIYLATDPDREGEAISWHVYEVLPKSDQNKCVRITFNEITAKAIEEAMQKPRDIDLSWVHSQFARRILDRYIGFTLSKLVRDKLNATSAGRVQTVALKFIYDREAEIARFKSNQWFTVNATLVDEKDLILREISKPLENKVKLYVDPSGQEGSCVNFADKESAELVMNALDKEYKVYAIDDPTVKNSNPNEPYKTSTMQQDAINKLGWNVGVVTKIAQHLYEGIRINGEHTALISYPRTDSTRISDSFAAQAKQYILSKYGEQYYQFRHFGSAKKEGNVQDAHEGIRVIDPHLTPESLKNKINKDEYALYKLIWTRTIAAYMTPAKYETTIVRYSNNGCKFYTYNRKLIFDGYKKIYIHYHDTDTEHEINIKNIKVGQVSKLHNIEVKEHNSQPPARFNQASLIKALEESGVGRPSTYNTMARVALERGYAKLEGRAFMMLPLGNSVIQELEKFFPDIISKDFTKGMEEHLDRIAEQKEEWKTWIKDDFIPKYKTEFEIAQKDMVQQQPEPVGRPCPLCGKELVYRRSKFKGTQFIGCSDFPTCKYVEFPNYVKPIVLDEKCPLCGKNLVERRNKRGQPFVGCSGYPKCHYIKKDKKPGDVKKTNKKKSK